MAQLTVQQTFDLAVRHHQAGRLREAERLYRQVLTQQPQHDNALHLLGVIAHQAGHNDKAVDLIRRAIAIRADSPEAHYNLGNILGAMGRFDEAVAAYKQAIRFRPNYPEAQSNLGNTLKENGQFDEGIEAHRQAIALNPDLAGAHNSLAFALKDLGQLDESIAAFRQAVLLKPDFAEAHGNLAFALYCHPAYDAEAIAEEHRRWNRQHAEPLRPSTSSGQGYTIDRDPDRRLRIGYVSGDFKDHPVGRFLLPLLEKHDHRQFEVFCYSNTTTSDGVTASLRSRADHWRQIVGVKDDQVAGQIRGDGIDILVDLSGHTGWNRLLVFARKPAPVQVSYLGYPGTTGLSAIDYRLTDGFADPPELTDRFHSEKLYRLPQTNWCFGALEDAPPVEQPPLSRRGQVTFGSFNIFTKVTEPTLQTWAEILRQVPGSRLMLKSPSFKAVSVREHLHKKLSAYGIEADRLHLQDWQPDRASHLAMYNEMDIALDTFPYNGTTTTCDALWMGVPVIALAGQTHISRVGVSLLSNIGLSEMIAATTDEYISLAVALARDQDRLKTLRLGLRERMKLSPLMDADKFARNVEAAFRQMWRTWCQTGSAGS